MTIKSLLAALFVAFCFCANTRAQTTEFTFQGSLKDGAAAANANYDFEFALFDALSAGSQIGSTIPKNNVAVANGIFSVRLDFGSVFPGTDRYLEIRVRLAGQPGITILGPRQLVNSAPYSVKSLNAASADSSTNTAQLGGVAADQYVVTNDPRMTDARDPLPNSTNYIQNQNAGTQAASNFIISGTGKAGVFDAATQFNLGGNRILGVSGPALGRNLFGGIGAGAINTSGTANTFVGTDAGASNTTACCSAFFGANAGKFSTGPGNSFFGSSAGGSNLSANQNSFFGYGSGGATLTGAFNTFMGYIAGNANTTGENNSFFGRQTGIRSKTGSRNTIVGANADFSATDSSGDNNTLLGADSQVSNGTLYGTAIGSNAVVNANDTIVLGKAAGTYNTIARPADSVSVPGTMSVVGLFNGSTVNASTQFNLGGSLALRRPNGSSLLAGTSGAAGISGVENTMFGQSTGSAVTSGARNTLMGFLAATNVTTANDNSGFGWRAGTTATGSGNSFFGSFAGGNFTGTGNNNTFVGFNADFDVSSAPGNNNSLLGANSKIDMTGAGQDISFATAIGSGSAVAFSDMVMIGKAAGTYNGVARPADIVRTAGIFQPALASPGGSPVCFNNGLSLCSSSRRYKSDITSYSLGLEIVRRLEPVTFSWLSNGKRDIGFVAEDVQKIEPLLTFDNQSGQIEGVQYAQITTVLVNAVKEQQEQIEKQQALIEQLVKRLDQLEKKRDR